MKSMCFITDNEIGGLDIKGDKQIRAQLTNLLKNYLKKGVKIFYFKEDRFSDFCHEILQDIVANMKNDKMKYEIKKVFVKKNKLAVPSKHKNSGFDYLVKIDCEHDHIYKFYLRNCN